MEISGRSPSTSDSHRTLARVLRHVRKPIRTRRATPDAPRIRRSVGIVGGDDLLRDAHTVTDHSSGSTDRHDVIVIGGTGHVGAALCNNLADLGLRVIATSRTGGPRFDRPGIEQAQLEVLDLQSSPMHLAGRLAILCPWVPLVGSTPPTDWVTPLLGRLADAGTTVVVYFSTMWVYGVQPVGRLTEESPTGSTNPYASAHLDNESTLTQLADRHGLDISILRMSNLIGGDPFFRRRSKIAFAHELTAMAVHDHRIVLRSPPDTARNLLPRALLHHDLTAVLDRPVEAGRISTFNVGGPVTTTMGDFANLIAAVVEQRNGHPVRVEHPPASGDQRTFDLDTDRIRSLAGVGPDDLTTELSMILTDVTDGHGRTVRPS